MRERRLAAIMFTDVVGYTALMAGSEETGLRVRARHREVVQPLVRRYRGESIEARGDESLSVFPTVLDAVHCGLAIQERLRDDPELKVHIGIHLGDLVIEDGEVSGDGVNIASRICALSEGGGLIVSGEVQQSIRNQPSIETASLGERRLKNVPEPVSCFEVTGTAASPSADASERGPPAGRHFGSRALAGAAVVLLLVLAIFSIDRFVRSGGRGAAEVDPRSVAAIPFENLSGDAASMPFTLGIHDDLLTQLSKIGSIRTTSRRAVLNYRETDKTIAEIARELGVATVVSGGVQRSGDRVRINVQLIDAARDVPLWAESYDRELSAANVFAIQGEIATSIADALEAKLTEGEQRRLAAVPTRSLAALDTYFVGKQLLEERNLRSLQAAAQYFEKVIELDPEFALAWSGLADAYMILPEYAASVDLDLVREKSVAAATRAYALDPESPEVLASLAWRRLIHEYDWEQAEKLLRRALEIHPHNTSALHWLSHVLSWQGRHTEAIELARRAVEADPGSTLMRTNLSYIYMDAGAFDESIRIAEETWERDPGYGEQMGNLYLTHLRAGRPADAARAMQLWAEATGRDLDATEELGGLFVRHARGEAVRVPTELLDRGDFVLEDRGQLYAFFRDTERTLASLERAVRERSGARSALSMKVNPLYDPFRSDPRFVELLRQVGLAP